MLESKKPTEMRIKHTLRVISRSIYLQPSRMVYIYYQKPNIVINTTSCYSIIARAMRHKEVRILEHSRCPKSAKRKSQPHNSSPTPHQHINVVRSRHPMGSVALPDCSAEAVSKQSQGHAQRSQVTYASGWPPRDSNRAPTVGSLPTAGVERKIEVISSVEPLQLELCLSPPYI